MCLRDSSVIHHLFFKSISFPPIYQSIEFHHFAAVHVDEYPLVGMCRVW